MCIPKTERGDKVELKMKKTLALFLCILFALSCASCSSPESAPSADLKEVLADMESQLSISDPLKVDTEDDLMTIYGIEAADVKQFAGMYSGTGINADEIMMVEAVDSDAAGRVKEKLEKRYQDKENETVQYLPDQYDIVQKGEVRVNGNYVSLLVAQDADKLFSIYEGYIK